MAHPLPLTGERTLPGVAGEEYWFARHEAAYLWAARDLPGLWPDAVVVEAGSGEGYGAEILRAAGARLVLALEVDAAAAGHAAAAYPQVATVRANLATVPLAAGSVDVAVSLQVVEHLWDLRGFLADLVRALRPGGHVVVSTPNRPVFSPGLPRGAKPTNPFHVEELDAEQLEALLVDAGLRDVALHGLHHGPRLAAWEQEHGGLVAAQVEAVTGTGPVPDGLAAFVATVTAEDFAMADADGAQDLVAVAVRP